MASLPNLLRDSKINALREQLRRHKSQPKAQQQQESQTPSPAEILRTFTAARKRKDSASALQNKECFNKLWALGREPDRLVANPRLHALHISQSRPRCTGPDEVRKKSLLALEVTPEDVVDVEMVDGWSLCSDDLDEDGEDDEVKCDGMQSIDPQPEETFNRGRSHGPSRFSLAESRDSNSDQEEKEEVRTTKAEEAEKLEPPPSHPLYESLRDDEKILGLLRFFDTDCKAEVKKGSSVAVGNGLLRSDSNGGQGGWDNTVWVVDTDNTTLGYSQSGNGYWIKW